MLLPLYSYWRYRKCYAEDEDEYISRIREADEPPKRRAFAFEDVANGLPLETIYGQDHIHFTTFVGSVGPSTAHQRTRSKSRPRTKSTTRSESRPLEGTTLDDGSDADSTWALGGNGSPKGITIETKWTITEEVLSPGHPWKI